MNNNTSPATIWLTGLSASGKTTLGARLKKELERVGIEQVADFRTREVRVQK